MTNESQRAPTPEVELLIEQVCREVDAAFGVRPDLSVETLPLVDAYVQMVAAMAMPDREERLDAVGAYFGEVARRKLEARWATEGKPPREWRIELNSCFLHFKPVGMAGEAMFGCENEEYDGSFATLAALHDELDQRLSEAPPLPEDEYYSLAGRIEVLTQVADILVAQALARAGERHEAPLTYSADDYRLRLDDLTV